MTDAARSLAWASAPGAPLVAALLAVGVAVGAIGCVHYRPAPLDAVPFLERAATMARGGLRVTVAVPTDGEAARLFGVPLADRGIQPVWVAIDNHTEQARWFAPVGLDPEYFTPLEAARRTRSWLRPGAESRMRAHFLALAVGSYASPGQRLAGFVFTRHDRGVKAVNIDLIGPGGLEQFLFMIKIPGLQADYGEVDLAALQEAHATREVSEAELRAALEAMPCCATTEDGRALEDPLNFVLIGTPDEVFPSFARTGWQVTEILRPASALRTFSSYFFGSRYRYAPISPVYLFGRRQDLSLQKARETARQRNHLRIWLAHLTFEGKPVWIGQISRDIGLAFDWKALVVHEVDPEVDEARNYLVQDMLRSQGLARFGWVKGVGPSRPGAPRRMADGTPFFTDGLRAVMIFEREPRALEDIRLLGWETLPPPAPVSDR